MWVFIVLLCIVGLIQAWWTKDIAERGKSLKQQLDMEMEHGRTRDERLQNLYDYTLQSFDMVLATLSIHTMATRVLIERMRQHDYQHEPTASNSDSEGRIRNAAGEVIAKPVANQSSEDDYSGCGSCNDYDQPLLFPDEPDERPNNVGGCCQ